MYKMPVFGHRLLICSVLEFTGRSGPSEYFLPKDQDKHHSMAFNRNSSLFISKRKK